METNALSANGKVAGGDTLFAAEIVKRRRIESNSSRSEGIEETGINAAHMKSDHPGVAEV